MTWIDSGPQAALVAGVVGALAGWGVGAGVPRLMRLEGLPTADAAERARPAYTALVGAVAAVALWWWEVVAGGLVPVTTVPAVADGTVTTVRWLGHVVLFGLLAAASWIDLRLRVIPDWITVPGVLAGLTLAVAAPGHLLPVAIEVPRSFAAPALAGDVLGAWGGLAASAPPAWLAPRPSLTGLAVMVAIAGCWWWTCTPIVFTRGGRLARLTLGGGLATAVGATWWDGGPGHSALATALVGIAVGGGLVFATRHGASLAMGREAMGFGDVTLMAMIGAWLGWQTTVIVFFLGVFLGLGHGVVQVLLHGEIEMPFGPSLCAACALAVVGWRTTWRLAGPFFEDPLALGCVLGLVVVLSAAALAGLQWWRSRFG
jgi:prepilin signal peptidase PulO-like enzyme (type II secretory pathway)